MRELSVYTAYKYITQSDQPVLLNSLYMLSAARKRVADKGNRMHGSLSIYLVVVSRLCIVLGNWC